MPASKTTIGRSFQKQHINCMHGFPCSRNKQKNAVDFKTKKFTAYGFTYAGTVPKKVNFSQYKKDPDVHVCLNYSIGKDDQRKKTNPFKPKGMSGGGLWLIPNSFNCNNLFLKGILIEHIGKTVFATKIEKVIGFIKKNA